MTGGKHTSGQWHLSCWDKNDQPQITAESGRLVAICAHECVAPKDELEANAHLIAAAPDLLEALENFSKLRGAFQAWAVDNRIPGWQNDVKLFEIADTAIARACGEGGGG